MLLLHIETMKCNETPPACTTMTDDDELQINSSIEDCEIKDAPTTGHKCMNCQVTPFQTADELAEHVKVKHTIRCKYCGEKSDSYKSRGYLNAHQKEDHPEVWKKIQERKLKKKAISTAATDTAVSTAAT